MDNTFEIYILENAAKMRGVSVPDICIALKISRGTWQRWKNGKSEPSISQFRQLQKLATGDTSKKHIIVQMEA